MSELIGCDSCGATLQLPTTPAAAASWQRLSIGVGKPFKYHCGKCNPTRLIKSMEASL